MTQPAASTAAAVYLRLAAALGALGLGAVAVVVVAVLLHRTPGPVAAPTTAAPAAAPATPSAPARSGFPAPPAGAVVFSRESGRNAVALAVVPGRPLRLQASVVGPAGAGLSGLRVALLAGGRRLATTSCGPGCYAARLDAAGPGAGVTVVLPHASVRFALPAVWPPADGAAIVARAGRVWRGLRTLVSHERLGYAPNAALHTVYRFEAPSSLSYTIRGESAAVVIGGTRWDRSAPGASWVRSTQSPKLSQPTPFWAEAVDAHVVGTTARVWKVSFYDPRSTAWFLVEIERKTYRTLDVRMIAASHFMHDVYGPFDAPFHIVPPA